MSQVVSSVTSRPHKYKFVDEGLLFRQAYKWDLESEEVAYMLIKVGDWYPHMLLMSTSDGDTTIEIFHSPTTTADGTEEPSGNYNFNSSNTSLTTWFPNPTVTVDGTYIANTWILGGSGVSTPSASSDSGTMYDIDTVLIPNVEFVIKFTNTSGRDLQVIMEAVYVERQYDVS